MHTSLDAIGIGCRRCASSFLHDCLNDHPDVLKPPRALHYFSEFADKGPDWYFSQLPEKRVGSVLIEYSVSYAYPEYAEAAAQRMFTQFPDAKLFVSVRNPVDRAFSDYLRSVRNLEIPPDKSFEESLESVPLFLERGRYQTLLEPYFERFPSDRILVLYFDDLRSGAGSYLQPLYRFLEIQEDVSPREGRRTREGGRSLRWPVLQSAILTAKKILDDGASALHVDNAWQTTKRKFLRPYQVLRGANTLPATMNKKTRENLRSYYDADIAWLSQMTGRNLKGWK